MQRAGLVGVFYFIIVFAAGFAFGTLRTLVMTPRLGETAAVALELPLLLLFSWVAARRLIGACRVEGSLAARLVMGAVAFALLMLAELALGLFAFGRALPEQAASWMTLPGALGLAGQAAFAIIPVVQLRLARRSPPARG